MNQVFIILLKQLCVLCELCVEYYLKNFAHFFNCGLTSLGFNMNIMGDENVIKESDKGN